ncbi:thioredoxin-like domain-containing protein [Cytophagales bacterium LB-30]|uniref:Thioredoxin-like domain-containing protein n=1 Tax=Shiella aurantiaca TaxID=3058365 RepID=A0ABT8F4B0_9BACT|nr:thioredoxin-like domain-containing protein [Shiella aurantiaca]MDN4165286.1 thioredoxin-like domain-containing protein [Shiella aurantiaca]
MRLYFLLFATFFLHSAVQAQSSSYKIEVEIANMPDTTLLLGNYYGESTYAKDTCAFRAGKGVFEGDKPLPKGVYFLILGKTKLFDLVVGTDQTFLLKTDNKDYLASMQVEGDEDNSLFFKNVNYTIQKNKEAAPHIAILQDSTASEVAVQEARAAMKQINQEVDSVQKAYIQSAPQTLTAQYIRASQALSIPESAKKADGSVDNAKAFAHYKVHFFDAMDLSNDAFLRFPRPIYTEKIAEYLDRMVVQQPDSIFKYASWIIEQAKPNTETYKYATWNILLKYQNPDIMGLDEVFVRLFDTYFASGEMDFWANAQLIKNLKEQADRYRKSLIGQKGANLIMQDQNFSPKSLYDIKKKYTVLYIFDPDCGHCKKETPKLVEFYNQNSKTLNVEVYAVSADTSMVKMKDYIRDMKMPWITVNGPRTYVGPYSDLYDAPVTPMIYVLDENKIIIGKKLPADKLADFLTRYEKMLALRKEEEKSAH